MSQANGYPMNQIDPFPPSGSASEQADYWLALLNSPLYDQGHQVAFEQWLGASPENRLAWEKAQVWWQKIDTINFSQGALLEKRLATTVKSVSPSKPVAPKRSLPFFNAWSFPAVACLLLAVWFGFTNIPFLFADYHTGKGELKSIALTDGSTVLLNTNSTLSVDYSSQQRIISLQGEAYFKVAADARRPFEVKTESGRVRALGTAFEVKQLDSDMAVTVYEHSVRVAFVQGETIDRLEEGQRITLTQQQIGPIENVNLKQSKAWQEHLLVFKNQPLQQVITELNRYRSGKVIIVDHNLAEHLVTGVFDSAAPDAALAAIEKTLAAKEYRLLDSLVFLTGM
ncbi:MAG: FecR family protein [Methylococcales bacterium]